jgi:hypothetical protein
VLEHTHVAQPPTQLRVSLVHVYTMTIPVRRGLAGKEVTAHGGSLFCPDSDNPNAALAGTHWPPGTWAVSL